MPNRLNRPSHCGSDAIDAAGCIESSAAENDGIRNKNRRQKRDARLRQYDRAEIMLDANNYVYAFNKSRLDTSWKASIQKYEAYLLRNIYQTIESVKNGDNLSLGFIEFELCERGHRRDIRSVHIKERVPQRLISDKVLIPVLSNSLIYDNGASLKDKGLHFSLNRLVAQLQKYHRSKNKDPNGYVSGRDPSGYILQIDFRHFFDSIPHKEVYRMLEEKFKDPTIRRIMHQLVDAFGPERSLGIGSQVSQILAVSFPNSVDHYIKEKLGIKFYGRYMDDLYLIHEDKEYLKKCLEGIRIEVAKIGLEINDRKTHISRIDRWFTFLKFKFKLEPTGKVAIRPSRDNIVRERRKLKKLQPKVEAGEIPFGAVEQQYESFKAHLSFASCGRTVRHMDRLFNDLYIKEWRKPYGRKKDNRTPEGRHSDRRFRQHPKPDSNVR